MLTVKDILSVRPFSNARIVAGRDGLERQISSVTVAEVPDAANWLQGGELVCTTAYFIRQGLTYQIPWFESLIKGGAAAVAIKTSRFLHTIPHLILEMADRYQIPLIEVSIEVTWPVIIESVMQLLSHEQARLIHSSADIHRKLIDLVLSNESTALIAQEIAAMIGQPVIIEDVHLNTIAHAFHDSCAACHFRLTETGKNVIRQSKFYEDVLRGLVKEKAELLLQEEPEVRNLVVPITSNLTVYGFLSVLYTKQTYRLLDSIVLENGAVALSFQFMRQRMLEQTIQTKATTLTQDLICGQIHTNLMGDPHFSYMDWSKPLYVVVMETFWNHAAQQDNWHRMNGTVQQILQGELNKNSNQYLLGFDGNTVVILVGMPGQDSSEAPVHLADMVGKAMAEVESRLENGTCKAGIGSMARKLSHLGKSYKEATEALSLGKIFPDLGSVISFKDVGIHRILSLITDRRELRSFTEDFLGPLIKHDQKNGEDLQQTLHIYLAQNGNINKTARALFVHPNTVLYRIKKIQAIIDRDLNSMDMRLTYLIALEGQRMLDRM